MSVGQLGFRPLSGIKVSEQNAMLLVTILNYCFRPLSGIKVSELYILYRLLTHIQHIVLGVSKSAFPIVITYNIIP